MKTITFKKLNTKHGGMTEFIVEESGFKLSLANSFLCNPTELKLALATFWFKAHPNDKAQDIDFKIEL